MKISWESMFWFSLRLFILIKEKTYMKKDIYKITNLINGKCYIGQTSNAKLRFRQHKNKGYGQEQNKILYYAFDKYGLENFSFEVIEKDREDYNQRQRYWIRYYDSFENGYNMTEGGEEPPLHIKQNSPFATHTQQEVDEIIKMILETDKTFIQIAELSGYDYSAIKRINSGIMQHDDSLDYPLRKENTKEFKDERAQMIIQDLLNSNLTQKEIASKYNCARSTVTAINIGQNNRKENLNYPLRKGRVKKH